MLKLYRTPSIFMTVNNIDTLRRHRLIQFINAFKYVENSIKFMYYFKQLLHVINTPHYTIF